MQLWLLGGGKWNKRWFWLASHGRAPEPISVLVPLPGAMGRMAFCRSERVEDLDTKQGVSGAGGVQEREWRLPLSQAAMLGAGACLGLASHQLAGSI